MNKKPKKTTTSKKAPKRAKAAVAVSKELEDLSLAFAQRAKADGGFQHELAASLLALASMVMDDDAANTVERLRGGRLGFVG